MLEDLIVQEPERKVSIEVAKDIVVNGAPRLLRIVLENVLGNAWKFTVGRDDALIAFGRVDEEDGRRALFVRDNGAGFDMDHAGKLFRPFQRLHSPRDFSGTGIGLATVCRIVTKHGGRIWARAVPGQGATFFLDLSDAN